METIQTDATINSGNSGGPICNINGEVIGITSSKLVGDGIEGMGFSIPMNTVNLIIEKLEKQHPKSESRTAEKVEDNSPDEKNNPKKINKSNKTK